MPPTEVQFTAEAVVPLPLDQTADVLYRKSRFAEPGVTGFQHQSPKSTFRRVDDSHVSLRGYDRRASKVVTGGVRFERPYRQVTDLQLATPKALWGARRREPGEPWGRLIYDERAEDAGGKTRLSRTVSVSVVATRMPWRVAKSLPMMRCENEQYVEAMVRLLEPLHQETEADRAANARRRRQDRLALAMLGAGAALLFGASGVVAFDPSLARSFWPLGAFLAGCALAGGLVPLVILSVPENSLTR